MAMLVLGYAVGMAFKPQRVAGDVPDPPAFDAPRAAGVLPGYDNVYVNDYAALLEGGAESRIRDDLIALYDATGVEMTVLTIVSRARYGFDGGNEAFATALFNAWGIGDAQRNDGVLILVSSGDRDMRIELGAGYGRARDGDMQRVIDRVFLPAFRDGRFQDGIERGVSATIVEIAGAPPDALSGTVLERGFAVILDRLRRLGGWLVALAALPVAAGAWGLRAYLRRRPRDCAACGAGMFRQTEQADDAHLDGGQRLEEYIGSVDYDIWECPDCAALQISRHAAWLSKFGACGACGYKTLQTDTKVLKAATTSSTGLRRIDYSCRHCGFADSETRVVPKKSSSSSGSGSGRSSFGGGRSGGGGASGSW